MFLVLFIFLQDWRATVMPAVTIPVSLIGTLAVMLAMGFSLNMLTLFGLVLAIGIVVDDAIVVVEATAAHMERGLTAKEAAIKAMSEVSGPVVATTLVLLAVFVPSAFLPGITGQMYRQFALTIAISTIFSSINALTLSPALAALLLRPPKKRKNIFFRGFDAVFRKTENGYAAMVKTFVRRTAIMLLLFVGLLALTGWQFTRLPTGFLPTEDQGYVMASIQLPDAASLERTQAVLDRIDGILEKTPGIQDWVSLGGYSLIDGTNASNMATVFIIMTPWEERSDPSLSMEAILADLQRQFSQIQEAIVFAFPAPGHHWAGGRRRLPDAARRPRRCRAGRTAANGAGNHPGRQRPVRADRSEQHLPGRCTPAVSPRSTAPRPRPWGFPSAASSTPCRPIWGRTTSTISTSSAAPGRSRSRPTTSSACEPDDIRRLDVRNAKGEMVPIGTLVNVDQIARAPDHPALQPLPVRLHHR